MNSVLTVGIALLRGYRQREFAAPLSVVRGGMKLCTSPQPSSLAYPSRSVSRITSDRREDKKEVVWMSCRRVGEGWPVARPRGRKEKAVCGGSRGRPDTGPARCDVAGQVKYGGM